MQITHGIARATICLVGMGAVLLSAACSAAPTPAASPTASDAPGQAAATSVPAATAAPMAASGQAGAPSGCVACHTSPETIDKLATKAAPAPKSAEAEGEG